MSRRLTALLWPSLPDAEKSLVLRAVLADGDDARVAWQLWRVLHPSLLDVLAGESTDALAALLPLLRRAAERHGLALAPQETTRLRTAALREELRARAYADVFVKVASALDHARLRFLVIGGRPLAELLYADPALHHTGAIDLVLTEGQEDAAAAALSGAGLRDLGRAGNARWARRRFQDASGLDVTMSDVALAHPHYRLGEQDLWSAASAAPSAAVQVLAPALHDQLVLTCVRGSWTGARRSMLWLIDAALLCARAELDWDAVVARGGEGRLALPLLAVLSWLSATLRAPVPPPVLEALSRAAEPADALDVQFAITSAAAASETAAAPMLAAVARAGAWSGLARWAARPHPAVVEWETAQAASAPSAAAMLTRPLGFLHRRILRAAAAGAALSRPPGER